MISIFTYKQCLMSAYFFSYLFSIYWVLFQFIGFAIALAKTKGWKGKKGIAQTEEELAAVMSQKIGELKRAHVANKKAKS